MPALPPSDTMPTDSSSSRSSATRCSAERPRSPNTSRSPRTSCTRLSGLTRPSACELPPSSRIPVWHGRSRAASRSISPSANSASISSVDTSISSIPVQPDVMTSWAWYSSAGQADRTGLDAQRNVLAHQRDLLALGGEVGRAGQDPRIVAVGPEARGQHRRVAVVQFDVQRTALCRQRESADPAVRARAEDRRTSAVPAGRTSPVRDDAVWPPVR